jgi:hypothetical protein
MNLDPIRLEAYRQATDFRREHRLAEKTRRKQERKDRQAAKAARRQNRRPR